MDKKVSNLIEIRRTIANQLIDKRETETPVFNETVAEYVNGLNDQKTSARLNKPLRKSPGWVNLREQ